MNEKLHFLKFMFSKWVVILVWWTVNIDDACVQASEVNYTYFGPVHDNFLQTSCKNIQIYDSW